MSLSAIFSGLTISASGMRAQRIRQNTISSNLANAETTRTSQGGPYRRQFAVLEASSDRADVRLLNRQLALSGVKTAANHLSIPAENYPRDERFFGSGVTVTEIRQDSRPDRLVYDPGHPDADEKGYVAMPNVSVIQEMTDMIAATRAYEANVTAFNAMKTMISQAIQI
ncbi:MAG: flagellar basal body rod protein FlgC [Chitinivibrionales bacterium]|nr:flagellar basal body rod protein FlgC [Chitinivibrionales bacterium]